MESATRIPMEQTSGASKSVFVPWNLVKDDVLYFSTFKMCVCVCVCVRSRSGGRSAGYLSICSVEPSRAA